MTKQLNKNLQTRRQQLSNERSRLIRLNDKICEDERIWKRLNIRNVQKRTLGQYFQGDLEKELTDYVDFIYDFTINRSKMGTSNADRNKYEKMYQNKSQLDSKLHKHTLALFRTIRKAPEPDRLILAHAIGPAFHFNLGSSIDLEYIFGEVRYSDGDMVFNAEKRLKILKLDHLVDWSPKGNSNYSAGIPHDKVKEIYHSCSHLSRESIETKRKQLQESNVILEQQEKELKTELKYNELAQSLKVPARKLKQRMPTLMEDLGLIERDVGSGVQELAVDPDTNTIVTISDRSVIGRGCGHDKIVSAYRDGSITRRTYSYRDPDSWERDRPEYSFNKVEIVRADDKSVNARLSSNSYTENVEFNFGGNGRAK